jgi:hypothetical protein
MTHGDARSHEDAARYACGVTDTISGGVKDRVMGGCAPKELYRCVEQFMPFSEGGYWQAWKSTPHVWMLCCTRSHRMLDAVLHEKPPHMKIPK